MIENSKDKFKMSLNSGAQTTGTHAWSLSII